MGIFKSYRIFTVNVKDKEINNFQSYLIPPPPNCIFLKHFSKLK